MKQERRQARGREEVQAEEARETDDPENWTDDLYHPGNVDDEGEEERGMDGPETAELKGDR